MATTAVVYTRRSFPMAGWTKVERAIDCLLDLAIFFNYCLVALCWLLLRMSIRYSIVCNLLVQHTSTYERHMDGWVEWSGVDGMAWDG